MSVMNRRQHDYLVDAYGDGLTASCGHPECQDGMEMVGISLASALDDYEVRGDQFASITMDLLGTLHRVCKRNMEAATELGLTKLVHVGIRVAAVAYHRYLEEHPDDIPEPDEEESPTWPSE